VVCVFYCVDKKTVVAIWVGTVTDKRLILSLKLLNGLKFQKKSTQKRMNIPEFRIVLLVE